MSKYEKYKLKKCKKQKKKIIVNEKLEYFFYRSVIFKLFRIKLKIYIYKHEVGLLKPVFSVESPCMIRTLQDLSASRSRQ